MTVTIYDIAKKTGVSPKTVARILNGESGRPKNVEKIKRVADELGYIRNKSAATLRSGKSNSIGVLISSLTNPFYPVFLESLYSEAKGRNLHIIPGVTFGDMENLRESVDLFIESRVAGIIASVDEEHPLEEWEDVVEKIIKLKIPLLLAGAESKWKEVPGFLGDETRTMTLIIKHLLERGRSNIGFVGGPLHVQGHKSRHDGFLKAMDKAKLKQRPSWILTGEASVIGGEQMALKLLQRKNRPDAIICSNDILAIGAIRAAHLENLDIPGQIAITGIDDIPLSEFTYPELTTVRQPRAMMAKVMLDTVSPETRNKNDRREMLSHVQLIARKSS
ncbi:MAG: LacI family transcriptional regulator [Kiritimatiellales bacterium]|nr:LacI family transcriptional regulator [Kiritimatiellales bacterium]